MNDVAYPYYQYQPNYFQPPMADQLMQLRQNQYQPNPQQIPQQQSPSIVWVQNEMEAVNYLVAPNSAVTLWDSNAPVVYLKQADASGKPSMKIYDLVERTQRPVQAQAVEYAPLSRLEALEARLNELTAIKEAPNTIKRTTTKEDAE